MIREFTGLTLAMSMAHMGYAMTMEHGKIINETTTIEGSHILNAKVKEMKVRKKPLIVGDEANPFVDTISINTSVMQPQPSEMHEQNVWLNGFVNEFIVNHSATKQNYKIITEFCVNSYGTNAAERECSFNTQEIQLAPQGAFSAQRQHFLEYAVKPEQVYNITLNAIVVKSDLHTQFISSAEIQFWYNED